ncbi:oligosaccharide flippase family protein [Spirulina sp. CCNP1310]|uniref:oligosaccharide flippase family protein n=1 Tax=Spirulina sp. CCNP1310 TaxID=3110249 RepID=UPI002B204D3E|nr:oligosaccharide flippase family protein [Spirulina sp. CCNP1310]MEA5418118.1 oligosaccharide flippase family protein [Spirulina sp. CCNP1310]
MTADPKTSTKKLAVRGATWVFLGYGANQMLRFVNNLILTRLLMPDFFGLMALATTLRMGLELFSDVGVNQSVVHSPRGEERVFLDTAWTVQVIRGFVLWGVSFLITVPAAQFYGDDRLLLLLPFVGMTTMVDSLRSNAFFTLNRRLEVGKLTMLEFTTSAMGLVVMITWAWLSPTVWALAVGGLAGYLFRTVGSYIFFKEPIPRWTLDRDCLIELARFGRWIFVSAAMMFLAEQSDRLILGRLLPLEMLGIYTIAYTMANIPRQLFKRLSTKVIFPAISQHNQLPRPELNAKIQRQRWPLLLLSALGVALLVSWGDLVILGLYDDRYQDAAWMMPILCGGIWFSVLFYTLSPALLAVGKPSYSAYSNFASLLVVIVGLPLSFQYGGLPWAIALISFSDIFPYLVIQGGLYQEKLLCWKQDILSTLVLLGMTALFLQSRVFLNLGMPWDLMLKGA